MDHDVAIIGGSFAGLSAAMQLARARRKVVVVDDGQPRNRFAAHSHGFLGQDGRAPAEILDEARRQLLAYPTASVVQGRAERCGGTKGAFAVDLPNGSSLMAARLILACGVTDTLPDIPGLRERWGRTVAHCPYCHGYEIPAGPIGVLATGPMSSHQAQLVADWAPVVFFHNGVQPEDAHAHPRHAITVERERVEAIEDDAAGLAVRLADGRRVALSALFTAPRTHPAGGIAEALGCALEDGPLGPHVRVDGTQQTSVPGVFAAGDINRKAANVAIVVADGAMAGAAAHRSLVFEA
jgi:thioredoxin reductase